MRKLLVAALSAFAIAGSVALQAAAPSPPEPAQGQFFGFGTRERPDNPACAQLPELRRQLTRLQEELRRLRHAFAQAVRAGNRERAEQIAHEIRRVQAEIDHVEHEIRRLMQECRGR